MSATLPRCVVVSVWWHCAQSYEMIVMTNIFGWIFHLDFSRRDIKRLNNLGFHQRWIRQLVVCSSIIFQRYGNSFISTHNQYELELGKESTASHPLKVLEVEPLVYFSFPWFLLLDLHTRFCSDLFEPLAFHKGSLSTSFSSTSSTVFLTYLLILVVVIGIRESINITNKITMQTKKSSFSKYWSLNSCSCDNICYRKY